MDLDILEAWLRDSTENLSIRRGSGLLDLSWVDSRRNYNRCPYCWIMDQVDGEFTVLVSDFFLFPKAAGAIISVSDPPETWEKALFPVVGKKVRPRLLKSYKEWAKEKGKI